MAERMPLPRLTMGAATNGVPREVGGKTYCAIHGKAHMDGACPACRAETEEPKTYKNICFISRSQARQTKSDGGQWDGKGGRPFIGEVVSVHIVGTASEIAAEEARLKALHNVNR